MSVSPLNSLHDCLITAIDIFQTNIFIDDACHALLADFGLSVVDNVTKRGMLTATNKNGSMRWMAPELCDPERFGLEHFERTQETDVYAFACTVLEVRFSIRCSYASTT